MDYPLRAAGARTAFIILLALLVSACASMGEGRISRKEHAQLESALRAHIVTLASDEFGGRKPGTKGETLTLDYLRNEFSRIGFESGTNDPGNPWLAPVMLISSKPKSQQASLVLGRRAVKLPDDQIVFYSDSRLQRVEGAEILYIGDLGSDLPEQDVKGRIVLAHWSQTMQDYERQLLDMGATAVIYVVDDPGMLDQTRLRSEQERYSLPGEEDEALHGFVTDEVLATGLGQQAWQDLRTRSASVDFVPVVLKAKINIETSSQVRELRTNNFIARLPGRIPHSGAILLMGHWDHLGICRPEGEADRICNGAVDNASGIALLIELGRRLASGKPLDRDVYVLGTTGEEMGLLGAKAFVEAPPMPLDSIVAAFNFDTMAVAPDGKTVGFIGQGETALDPLIIATLHKMKRKLALKELADQFLRRQDGWVLLNRDIPTVALSNMMANKEILSDFMARQYHRPNDDARNLILGGTIDDLLLHDVLVRRLASVAQYPGPIQQTH